MVGDHDGRKCTFVNGVNVWPLEPVCSVDQQVNGKEAPLELAQALHIRFHMAVLFLLVGSDGLDDCRFAGAVRLVESKCIEKKRSSERSSVKVHVEFGLTSLC